MSCYKHRVYIVTHCMLHSKTKWRTPITIRTHSRYHIFHSQARYWLSALCTLTIGLLPDTYNCGLHMRRECREHFPPHRLQRNPLVSDHSMHQGMCVMHLPWCMSGWLTCGGEENVPGISQYMRNLQFYLSGKRPMLQYIPGIRHMVHALLCIIMVTVDDGRFYPHCSGLAHYHCNIWVVQC